MWFFALEFWKRRIWQPLNQRRGLYPTARTSIRSRSGYRSGSFIATIKKTLNNSEGSFLVWWRFGVKLKSKNVHIIAVLKRDSKSSICHTFQSNVFCLLRQWGQCIFCKKPGFSLGSFELLFPIKIVCHYEKRNHFSSSLIWNEDAFLFLFTSLYQGIWTSINLGLYTQFHWWCYG